MAVFDVVGGAEPGNDREEDHDTRHNLKYTRSCHDPCSVTMNCKLDACFIFNHSLFRIKGKLSRRIGNCRDM